MYICKKDSRYKKIILILIFILNGPVAIGIGLKLWSCRPCGGLVAKRP
jgi:hypothetical protein